MTQVRLPFELDVRAEAGALTAHGGVPLLIEAFRTSGAAAVLDASVVINTNRSDPEGGSGLDLIRWQRGKAWPPGWGTGPQPRSGGQAVEHAHHVLTNELAAEALPSQKFGANAAWFRLNVMLYNLLAAFKRVALPPALHDARPKRLRFVLLNGIGKVVRHARETVLRLVGDARRRLADAARLALAARPPFLFAA